MRHISSALLGAWIAIFGGTVGSFVAIWAGYLAAKRRQAKRPGGWRR